MSQPTADAPAVSCVGEARKARRAGQTCYTLLVLFAVTLFAFGKPPWLWISDGGTSRLDFDLISCLGVAAGAFALLFLLTNLRRIIRLPAARKTLGLVACAGLIVHAGLALFMPLSHGHSRAVGTGGNQPFARTGPEQWLLAGESWPIESTYYLRLGESVQYTIEYPYRFGGAIQNMNDSKALGVVFPLMKHAYTNGLYKRGGILKVGKGPLPITQIGVALFERNGQTVRGYRVSLTLDEIRRRIEIEAPSTRPAD